LSEAPDFHSFLAQYSSFVAEAKHADAGRLVVRSLVEYPEAIEFYVYLARLRNLLGDPKARGRFLQRAFLLDRNNLLQLEASKEYFWSTGRIGAAKKSFLQLIAGSARDDLHRVINRFGDFLLCQGEADEGWGLHHLSCIHNSDTDPELMHGTTKATCRGINIQCGDDVATTIHHSRWFEGLAESTNVTFTVPERLAGTLSRAFPDLSINNPQHAERAMVSHLTSVPALASSRASAPLAHIPPNETDKTIWRRRLRERFGGRRVVGLSWRSSLSSGVVRAGTHNFDAPLEMRLADLRKSVSGEVSYLQLWRKQVPLKAFKRLFDNPGIQVIAVQHGFTKEEADLLVELGVPLEFPDVDLLGGLEDVFSFIAALDGFMAIPNTNAHIAAVLGIPTAVLVRNPPAVLWGAMPHHPHYLNVRVVQKTATQRSDGYDPAGGMGDWKNTVAQAIPMLLDMMKP
jgi:hypothetical protein